jgi:hypothetical protein
MSCPPWTLAQGVEKKEAESKTPHFLSLNQDIVAWSQNEKCRLKYDMLSPTRKVGEFVSNLDAPSLPGFGDLR